MKGDLEHRPLHWGFIRIAERSPGLEALRVEGGSHTYGELYDHAARLSATLQRHAPEGCLLTGVLARRSLTAYSGLLAALMCGTGYLTLNPKHPPARVRSIIERTGVRCVLVDESGEALLEETIGQEPRVWVLPHRDDVSDYQKRWPTQTFVGASDLEPPEAWVRTETSSDDIAYVLFTSGSTGEPKGVVIEHGNITHYVDELCSLYEITSEDQMSQFPETTFDGSVLDIWCAWEAGATLCVPSDMDVMRPHEFIVREEVTIWVFVPSLSATMLRLGLIKPGSFPKLRIWGFGGEAVPLALARACTRAAPNAMIDNHYGPTEATVSFTLYRWFEGKGDESEDGTLPMGLPFPGNEIRLLDGDLQEVAPGTEGELWLGGPQVARGYWQDPARTTASFRRFPGSDFRFYRTGDRAVYDADLDSFRFLGRVDEQVQIRGHRVEPAEIEMVLRELTGKTRVVAVGWPITAPGSADGIVAFVEAKELDVDEVLSGLSARLPEYSLPRKIVVKERFPLTANGKIDRSAMVASLDDPEQ